MASQMPRTGGGDKTDGNDGRTAMYRYKKAMKWYAANRGFLCRVSYISIKLQDKNGCLETLQRHFIYIKYCSVTDY